MRGKESSFEDRIEGYRRKLGQNEARSRDEMSEPLIYELRGSTLSMGTFSSNGKTSEQMLVEEKAKLDAVAEANSRFSPSRSRRETASPGKYSRNVQSADNTLIEDGLSPPNLSHVLSPRFQDPENPYRQTFVSDYVAFGRSKDSSSSSKDQLPLPKKPEPSFSLYQSDTGSYLQIDDFSVKITRLEQQLQQKNQVITEMSKMQEDLMQDMQENQRRFEAKTNSLENEKTEAQIMVQDSQREAKAAESRCRQVLRELEELRSQQQTKEDQYRKLDQKYANLPLIQKKIDDLENEKSTLLREITELKHEIMTKAKENEILKGQITTLERDSREQLTSKGEELHSLKKERLRLLKDLDESKRREAVFDREIKAEISEKERLHIQLQELQLVAQTTEDRKELEESIDLLRHENEALMAELRERPTQIVALERKIEELQSELREEKQNARLLALGKDDRSPRTRVPRGGSKGRKRQVSGGSRQHTEESPAGSKSKSPTSATLKRLLRELMEVLGAGNSGELVSLAKGLVRKAKSLSAAYEFIEKINGIVIQYSPPGTFLRPPSLKQVWKWVSRLIDEYMLLRKTQDSGLNELISELTLMLGVPHHSDLPRAIDKLLNENAEFKEAKTRGKDRREKDG